MAAAGMGIGIYAGVSIGLIRLCATTRRPG